MATEIVLLHSTIAPKERAIKTKLDMITSQTCYQTKLDMITSRTCYQTKLDMITSEIKGFKRYNNIARL